MRVWSVCPIAIDGRQLLASGGGNGTVLIWDPADGSPLITIPVRYAALAIREVATLLAIGLNAGVW